MAKEEAQEGTSGEALSPLPPFDGVTPLMQERGLPYYEWHARSLDLDVKIRKASKRGFRPVAVVRVSSQALWRLGDGGKRATLLAAEWLRPIFKVDGYRVVVSKVHIATDYQGHTLGVGELDNVVSRAGDSPYFDGEGESSYHRDRGKRLTGVASGCSTNLRLNLYDKTVQVAKKGLGWVAALWERCAGYRPGETVWRVEYQYGREFLHGRAIETVGEFFAALPKLWSYGMGWYSFRSPSSTDSNRARWAVAGWWSALSTWAARDAGELPRVKVVRPKVERLAAGLAGYLTSVMALTGLDVAAEALGAALRMAAGDDPGGRGAAVLDAKLAAKKLRYAGFTMADV
jgi:hypothetical protein